MKTDSKGSPNKGEHHFLTGSNYLKTEATSQICLAVGPKEVIIGLSKQLKNMSLSGEYYF